MTGSSIRRPTSQGMCRLCRLSHPWRRSLFWASGLQRQTGGQARRTTLLRLRLSRHLPQLAVRGVLQHTRANQLLPRL